MTKASPKKAAANLKSKRAEKRESKYDGRVESTGPVRQSRRLEAAAAAKK